MNKKSTKNEKVFPDGVKKLTVNYKSIKHSAPFESYCLMAASFKYRFALNVCKPVKMKTELGPLKNARDFFKEIIYRQICHEAVDRR